MIGTNHGSTSRAVGSSSDESDRRQVAVTFDRVGPGGQIAPDSAFGVALVTLWQRVAEAGAPVGFAPPIIRADIAARAAGLVDDLRSGRMLAVAANRARRLVGVALVRPGRDAHLHTGRIELLLVDPEQARSGVGSRLLTDLLGLAGDRNLERLEVSIPDGVGLDEFFGRFGFTEWGRRPGWVRLGPGDVRDEVVLGVLL